MMNYDAVLVYPFFVHLS